MIIRLEMDVPSPAFRFGVGQACLFCGTRRFDLDGEMTIAENPSTVIAFCARDKVVLRNEMDIGILRLESAC
jgi:hypothetical protein